MAEIWPGSVPSLPQYGSLSGQPFRAPLRTDFEDGNRRQRRRTTKNTATYQYEVAMTNAEYAIFASWVRDDLVDGSLPFTALVWTATGQAERLCSFVEPYRDEVADFDLHRISMTLDIQDY
jgi:hypothetical protein